MQEFKAVGAELKKEMLWQESVMSSMDQMQMIGQTASLAQFTELNTVENENAPSMIVWDQSMLQ